MRYSHTTTPTTIRTIRRIARAERFAAAIGKKLERAQDGPPASVVSGRAGRCRRLELVALAAAADKRRNPAAHGEPDHGRTDDHGGPMPPPLPAPVGQREVFRAKVLDRHRELMPRPLDRAPDLLWT